MTLAGVFQTAFRFLAPCMAAHVFVPTTATAFTTPDAIAPRASNVFTGTTAVAPAGTPRVRLSVAPKAGACRMAANTMPVDTAAPEPPLDPPGLCSWLHGFRTGP